MNMAAPLLALEMLPGGGGLPPALSDWRHALGLICYGEVTVDAGAVPCAWATMPVLGGAGSVCEIWRSASVPNGGRLDGLSYRQDGSMLFGCLTRDDSTAGSGSSLREAARDVYAGVFAAADALGFPHLVRCWNYFSGINLEIEGIERYRQFNIGRQEGFSAGGRALDANLPAACALGTHGGPLVVAFLAAREAPVQVENPRQISAYDYPPEYGPRSPTFARASLLTCADGEFLFVSGTASIVGHRTLHVGDAGAQTAETLANLRAVIAAANRASHVGGYALRDLALKVYLRNAHDLAAVRAQIESAPDAPAEVVYLQADICRRDLLVEIEATAHSRPASSAAAP